MDLDDRYDNDDPAKDGCFFIVVSAIVILVVYLLKQI